MATRISRAVLAACISFLVFHSLTGCAQTKEAEKATKTSHTEASQSDDGTEISAAEVERSGMRSVEELLQGRAAGVIVEGTTGGGFRLLIRGTSSLEGRNDPLIVIDGKPLPKWHRGSIPVSPYDVESIRVLKSATDLAFYGSRGANGVISIETKRAGG